MTIQDEYTNRSDLTYREKWVLRNPEKAREIWRKSNKKRWATTSPEEKSLRLQEERERWHALPFQYKRSKWLKTKYGLSYEQYETLFSNQNGKCAICKSDILLESPEKNSAYIACVDHNHQTKKVRGLLCNHCNRALGLMKESIANLKNMIQYLEKYND